MLEENRAGQGIELFGYPVSSAQNALLPLWNSYLSRPPSNDPLREIITAHYQI